MNLLCTILFGAGAAIGALGMVALVAGGVASTMAER